MIYLLGGHEGRRFLQRRLIMDQSGRSISGRLPLGRLVADALVQLEQLRYDRKSLRLYRTT
jgi:hypothetical protein